MSKSWLEVDWYGYMVRRRPLLGDKNTKFSPDVGPYKPTHTHTHTHNHNPSTEHKSICNAHVMVYNIQFDKFMSMQNQCINWLDFLFFFPLSGTFKSFFFWSCLFLSSSRSSFPVTHRSLRFGLRILVSHHVPCVYFTLIHKHSESIPFFFLA